MATIEVVIKNGEITWEVDGVLGSGCEDLTRALAEAVGGAAEVSHKPQYYVELVEQEQSLTAGD